MRWKQWNHKKRAWHVLLHTNNQQELRGYQDKSKGKVYPIVNAVTKAWIRDRYLQVLLVMNYATMIDDKEEK